VPNTTLGKKIKQEREKNEISLRKFAEKLKISPAYLVDIEKNRRLPKGELLQKIADLLDIPVSDFDEFSPEIPKPVRDWLHDNPLVVKVLDFLRTTPAPEKALARLERSSVRQAPRKHPMAIYESELQMIGLESSSWEMETGGDLFGVWGDIPVVYLASRAGPQAKREHTHFRLDVDYLIKLSSILEKDWGLRYFGDWHSHHSLGLEKPSSGDKGRIARLAEKNNFDHMAEFITTFTSKQEIDKQIVLHPYVYLDLPSHTLTEAVLIVLKGVSPVRSALMAESSLPEQQLDSFSSFPTERIHIPDEPVGRVPGTEGSLTNQMSERLLARTVSKLASVSSGDLELHREPFGFVIVMPVNDREYVALALEKKWPHVLLQVDWINRESGSAEEIPIDTGDISALYPEQLKKIFSKVKKARAPASK